MEPEALLAVLAGLLCAGLAGLSAAGLVGVAAAGLDGLVGPPAGGFVGLPAAGLAGSDPGVPQLRVSRSFSNSLQQHEQLPVPGTRWQAAWLLGMAGSETLRPASKYMF